VTRSNTLETVARSAHQRWLVVQHVEFARELMVAEIDHGFTRVLFVAGVDVNAAFEDDEHVGAALATRKDCCAGRDREVGGIGADDLDHGVRQRRKRHFGPEGREVELSRGVGECGRHGSIVGVFPDCRRFGRSKKVPLPRAAK
jgi:hypothetical protein